MVYSYAHPTMKNGLPCYAGDSQFTNGITNGAAWYSVAGGMQDYNYFHSNCFEITVEMGCVKFPVQTQLRKYWREHKGSLLAYMRQVHVGVKGFVWNTRGQPLAGAVIRVRGINHTVISSTHGDYWRLLAPGLYVVDVFARNHRSQSRSIRVRRAVGPATVCNFKLQPITTTYAAEDVNTASMNGFPRTERMGKLVTVRHSPSPTAEPMLSPTHDEVVSVGSKTVALTEHSTPLTRTKTTPLQTATSPSDTRAATSSMAASIIVTARTTRAGVLRSPVTTASKIDLPASTTQSKTMTPLRTSLLTAKTSVTTTATTMTSQTTMLTSPSTAPSKIKASATWARKTTSLPTTREKAEATSKATEGPVSTIAGRTQIASIGKSPAGGAPPTSEAAVTSWKSVFTSSSKSVKQNTTLLPTPGRTTSAKEVQTLFVPTDRTRPKPDLQTSPTANKFERPLTDQRKEKAFEVIMQKLRLLIKDCPSLSFKWLKGSHSSVIVSRKSVSAVPKPHVALLAASHRSLALLLKMVTSLCHNEINKKTLVDRLNSVVLHLAFPTHFNSTLQCSEDLVDALWPVKALQWLEAENVLLAGLLTSVPWQRSKHQSAEPRVVNDLAMRLATNFSSVIRSHSAKQSCSFDPVSRSQPINGTIVVYLPHSCCSEIEPSSESWPHLQTALSNFIASSLASVRGQVADASGRILPGALVCEGRHCAFSDENGSFWLLTGPGKHRLRVSASLSSVSDGASKEDKVMVVNVPGSAGSRQGVEVYIRLRPKQVLGMSKPVFTVVLSIVFLFFIVILVFLYARFCQKPQHHQYERVGFLKTKRKDKRDRLAAELRFKKKKVRVQRADSSALMVSDDSSIDEFSVL